MVTSSSCHDNPAKIVSIDNKANQSLTTAINNMIIDDTFEGTFHCDCFVNKDLSTSSNHHLNDVVYHTQQQAEESMVF